MAKGFEFCDDSQTVETQRFCSMFDKFFDCLNGRNKDEHFKRKKPNLKPYCKADDERLTVRDDTLEFGCQYQKGVLNRGFF